MSQFHVNPSDMQSVSKTKHVVLTGPPGIGKTTLVQNACSTLREKNIPIFGFVTSEIRDAKTKQRTGFQIIHIVDGESGILASINSTSSRRVGAYGVEVEEFEKIALPTLDLSEKVGVLILDEIGKMEMFSEKFKTAVNVAFNAELVNVRILATIPIQRNKPISMVETIRNHPDVKLFSVDRSNRNIILSQIIDAIVN